MEEKKKVFKRDTGKSFLEDKIEAINNSQMPEWQKLALLKEIGAGIAEPSVEGKVAFLVYAKIKKISSDLHDAMMAYPKAKGVSLALTEEWDEIFKDF